MSEATSAPSATTCVIGLGRVGLPTAVLAAHHHRVIGVDKDARVRDAVASGKAGAREPGLPPRLADALSTGRLQIAEAPVAAATTVLCVPTPLDPTGRPDLRDLDAAVAAVAPLMPARGLAIVASTVPVGTTDRIGALLREGHPDRAVAACPERVLPGGVVREMIDNPRIVGGIDEASAVRACAWLSSWVAGPIARTDARTAELAKLMENAARDVEIALAQTVADTARALGVDPARLRELVDQHPRIQLRDAGIGVGGHCLPVDPWFAIDAAPHATALLQTAREVNDAVPRQWIARIGAAADARNARRIGLLGLAYKPGTDDVRSAPAVAIARGLARRYEVIAADPFLDPADAPLIAPVPLKSVEEALRAELVVLLVAHAPLVALRDRIPEGTAIIDAVGGWR